MYMYIYIYIHVYVRFWSSFSGCGTVKSIGGVIRRSHRDDPNNIKLLYDCVWVMKTPHPNIFSYINILGMELDNCKYNFVLTH